MTSRDPMTNVLANSAKEARDWKLRRDGFIRQAHAEGKSTRTIAGIVGLSHQRVYQIIKEGER